MILFIGFGLYGTSFLLSVASQREVFICERKMVLVGGHVKETIPWVYGVNRH